MKTLKRAQCDLVAGGTTCKEALIANATTWEFIDLTQFCSKDQFTIYAFSLIDLMYSVGFNNVTVDMEVGMIQGLAI